jgi:hypothetical protein
MHPSAGMPENRNPHDDPSEPHTSRHLDDRNRQPMRDERDDWRGEVRGGRYAHGDPFVERERLGYGYERRPTGYTYGYGYGYDDGGMEDRDRDRGYGGTYGQPQPPVRYRELHVRGPHRGKGPRGFQRSDERIRELVNEALTDHDEVDATNIEVAVRNGEVTLTGTVEDRRTKRMAEDCVERISGVIDVQNQLKIGVHDSRSTRPS